MSTNDPLDRDALAEWFDAAASVSIADDEHIPDASHMADHVRALVADELERHYRSTDAVARRSPLGRRLRQRFTELREAQS